MHYDVLSRFKVEPCFPSADVLQILTMCVCVYSTQIHNEKDQPL